VLGNFSKREKFNWRSLAKGSQTCTTLRCIGVSGSRLVHPVNRALSGKSQGVAAIIHWTVRCASHASRQRLTARSVDTTCARPMVTGLHRTVRCAMELEAGNSRLHQTRKGIMHCSLSSVHRTVQCTRRQKVNMAFQLELQRLLGPLRTI
jgi:hypothetical protein